MNQAAMFRPLARVVVVLAIAFVGGVALAVATWRTGFGLAIGIFSASLFLRTTRGVFSPPLQAWPGGPQANPEVPRETIGSDVYEGLRSRALSMTPEQLNLTLSETVPTPFGVLMEMGLAHGIATLVAFKTGDASLYLSTGGGLIGGGGNANTRAAAIAFVEASAPYLARMEPIDTFPRPPSGRTRFYVLTTRGTLSAEFSETDLAHNKVDVSALFFVGQEVITQLRTATNQK